MIFIFIFGAALGLFVLILKNMDGELVITIHSKYTTTLNNKNINLVYIAKLKPRLSGYNINDWDYYTDYGHLIKDKNLTKLIHSSFVDEDWYGDYIFYVNDQEYYSNTTSINEVNREKEIIDSIDKMEDMTHRSSV